MIKLKEIRKKRNMTQQEVAEKLNVSHATYWGYEIGKYQPNIEILIAMSKLFKVSIDYLVGNENEFTIDLSELSEIKRYTLLYYLKQEGFDELQSYRAIREKQEWIEENPEEAAKQREWEIEEELRQIEWAKHKMKKLEEQEKKNKGNKND